MQAHSSYPFDRRTVCNPDDVKSGETFSVRGCSPPSVRESYTCRRGRERQGRRSINLGSRTAPRVNSDSTDKVSGVGIVSND